MITDILELREIKWRACVIDEAHRLKNAKCKLLDGLNLLVLESRLLLSGTPLQNNINELYSLLSFLEPQQFSSQTEFMKEFGDMQNEEQVKKLQVLLKPLMLRYNRYLTIAFFLQLNVLLITPVPACRFSLDLWVQTRVRIYVFVIIVCFKMYEILRFL